MDSRLAKRFFSQIPSGGNLPPEWYEPFDAVASSQPFALPVGSDAALDGALDQIVEYLARFRTQAVVVAHGPNVVRSWYDESRTADTFMQSQSMHKTVQAMLIGAAIERGLIGSPADRVGAYVPEWAHDPRGAITLLQLMSMRSGLQRFKISPSPTSAFWRMLFASDSRSVVLSAAAVGEPGSKFEYNDVNAALLGMAIEGASGMSYAQFLNEVLIEPLGVREAHVWLSDEQTRRPHTECCLIATPDTWIRLGMLLRDGGRFGDVQVLPAAWVDQMLTPSVAETRNYGLFTWLDSPGYPGPGIEAGTRGGLERPGGDLVYLAGYGGQRTWVSRSLDTVIVRMGPYAGARPLHNIKEWDDTRPMREIEAALA